MNLVLGVPRHLRAEPGFAPGGSRDRQSYSPKKRRGSWRNHGFPAVKKGTENV
jgi:hypothetical protein